MATAKTAPTPTKSPPGKPGRQRSPAPVLKVTRYDLVTAFMSAVFLGLVIAAISMWVVWLTNRLSSTDGPAELELVEIVGGDEDGAPDQTLEVESPDEPVEDPQVDEMLENVVELSDRLADMNPPQEEISGTTKGSAIGTGRPSLGSSGGRGGLGREQRWFIRFSDRGTLETYARQLEFFGIELGAVFEARNEIVYMSNLSSPKPSVRTVTGGTGENRMYMIWRGGNRKQGDIKLFKKAGVNVGGGKILHFYPKKTEQLLARIERDHANREADQIRRTYFVVRGDGAGFRFVVTRQSYFQ